MEEREQASIGNLIDTIDDITAASTEAQVNKVQIFVLVSACRYIRIQINVWANRCADSIAKAAGRSFFHLNRVLVAVLDLVRKYSTPDWIEKPWLYVARENSVVFEALLGDLALHVDLAMAALISGATPRNPAGTREWIAALRRTSWEYFKALRCGLRISAGEDKTRLLELLDEAPVGSSVTANVLLSASSSSGPSQMDWIDPDELDLENSQPLGSGSYGFVFQTTWAGHKVAVKKFSRELWAQDPWEGEIMVKLRPCHPSVLQILGWSEKEFKPYLVMELMQGSLAQLIPSLVNAPLIVLVEIMLQIAQGMDFVHKKRIIHRDLKPANVLINFDGRIEDGSVRNIVAKVADFGLSKMNFSSNHFHSLLKGTILYMAPEMLEGEWEMKSQYERSVDVYSYGMMCAQMLTGTIPYPSGLSRKAQLDEIMKGLRPRLPERCPQDLKNTISSCWDTQPRRRPTFENICTRLWRIKGELLTGSVYCMLDAGISVQGKLLVGEKLTGRGCFLTDTEWSTCYWIRHQQDGTTVRLTQTTEIDSRRKYPEYVITGCDYDSSIELVCISVDCQNNTTMTSSAVAGYGGTVDCNERYKMATSMSYAVKVFEEKRSWKGRLEIGDTGLKLVKGSIWKTMISEPYTGLKSLEGECSTGNDRNLVQCVLKGSSGSYRLQFGKVELRDSAAVTIIRKWKQKQEFYAS